MSFADRFGWGLMAFLSVGVGGYALFLVATGFQYLGLQSNFPSPLGLQTHIAASGIALSVGAFQFLDSVRRKAPVVHRQLGRVYVAACVVGGLAGGVIAPYSQAGLPAGAGFLLLALLWVPFTLLAWRSALRRDFTAHRRWMIRSFALTFAAVTLRVYLPPAIIANGGEFPVLAYQIIAWAAWVPNLIVAEIWLSVRGPKKRRSAPVAA